MGSSGWWDQGAEPALKGHIAGADLVAGAVGTDQLADGAATAVKLAAAAVIDAKLGTGVRLIGASLGTPSLASATRFLSAATMKATPYTVLNAGALPAGNPPRNISVTHVSVTAGPTDTDTLGSLHVVGTDYADAVISEDIVIVADSIAYGTKAFKTVTSLQTPTWVIDAAAGIADTLSVGFGPLLGMSRMLSASAQVFLALFDGLVVAAPTIAVSATVLASNTIDLSAGTYNGSKIAKVLLAP